MRMYVYCGSGSAQPARLRAFIDLALKPLVDSKAFVLTPKELSVAEAKGETRTE